MEFHLVARVAMKRMRQVMNEAKYVFKETHAFHEHMKIKKALLVAWLC